MNYYKRYIGDIQAKTGGLTLAEFGAYDRLLDHYYSTEEPVPAGDIYRICRAMTAGERASVNKVLSRFFELVDGGYAQTKADEQIAKAQPLIEAARANGKKGGRPPKSKTQSEPAGFPKQNPAETEMVKPLQHQTTSIEVEERERKRSIPPRPDDVEEQVWVDWVALRKSKRAPVSDTVLAGARKEADKANLSLQKFLEVWCTRGSQGLMADWLRPSQRGPVNGNRNSAAAAAIFGPSQSQHGEVIDV